MSSVLPLPRSIRELREAYRQGILEPLEVLNAVLSRANSNSKANVYMARDEEWSRAEAKKLRREDFDAQPLWGVPVSMKDCFDLQGFMTTAGSKVLGAQREPAIKDSALAARLRASGAVIVGKTHMHQLAYGITGESSDFGDCLQPGAEHLLTGGSSSGAAASVLEGSAMAGIGTDTGGSVRVPASLCGLMGYRGSVTLGEGLWDGGEHLAASFDTVGWLYRDASDGPLLGRALFGLEEAPAPAISGLRVGVPSDDFLAGCDPDVLATLKQWKDVFERAGARVERFGAAFWSESVSIYSPIQANEAAALRPEPRDIFETVIAQRLRWGANISQDEISEQRSRMAAFRKRCEEELAGFDVLLLPSTPVAELRAGEDHSETRARLLRYTTPMSLTGWPAVVLPGRGAPNIAAKMGRDAELLALSASLVATAKPPLQ